VPSSLDDRLRALRREFVEGLPTRADEVAQWLDDAMLEPAVLARICHRLRGLAPTHGLSELGHEAALLEDLAKAGASRTELAAGAGRLLALLRAPIPEPGSMRDAPLRPLTGFRVVAIDDDDAMRRLLRLTLVDLGGANATIVADEAGLVGALERGPADLVIADLMMPGTTGPALLARVRAKGLLGPARIVLLTASGAEGLGEDPRWARLSKPFRPEALVGTLAGIVRGTT
jgi:CheY-like chemotaxis protein